MTTTSLIIGARDNWQDATLSAPSGTVSASLGALFLDHATAALSLFSQLEGISGIDACALLKNGHTQITMSSTQDLTWGSATVPRDLMGFTGDKTGSDTYVSDLPSPIVWFPNRQEEPLRSILGVSGAASSLRDVAVDRSGKQTSVRFSQHTPNTFLWRWVPQAKFWTPSELNGEWYSFFFEVLDRNRRFQLYRGVDMDDSSSSPASYSNPLGTFEADLAQLGSSPRVLRSEGFEMVDMMFDVELPVLEVGDYA